MALKSGKGNMMWEYANLPAGLQWESGNSHAMDCTPRTWGRTVSWALELTGRSLWSPGKLNYQAFAHEVGTVYDGEVSV